MQIILTIQRSTKAMSMITKEDTKNIKGFAIIMVLIGHLVAVRHINVNINFLDLATFGVSIFLFLSGFGLYKSCKTNGMDGFF